MCRSGQERQAHAVAAHTRVGMETRRGGQNMGCSRSHGLPAGLLLFGWCHNTTSPADITHDRATLTTGQLCTSPARQQKSIQNKTVKHLRHLPT